jgi:hypothetical protein
MKRANFVIRDNLEGETLALRMGEGKGLADRTRFNKEMKKEEFPGIMRNMPPGNSFPQICVVSVNKSVEIRQIPQEYGRSMPISNSQLRTIVTRS